MNFSATTESQLTRSVHQWQKASNDELIDFILERFHALHREQLPEAIELALKIEGVHGDEPECPSGLAEHLQNVFQELESHMMKEEHILFPMLRQNSYPSGPIMVMESEHEDHELAIRQIEILTNHFKLPADACGSWRELYRLLKELTEDLRAHIDLENGVLFVDPEVRAGKCCGSCQ